MVRKKKPAKPAKPTVPTDATTSAGVSSLPRRVLKRFFDGAGQFPNFSFGKFYWAGDGPRGYVGNYVDNKLKPGSGLDGEESDMEAAKWDLLVPAFAPDDYSDLGLCLYGYDRAFSAAETNAFVQLTFRFPLAWNLHHCWEMVRAFARAEIVDKMDLPVVLILHKPQAAGSHNDAHIHAIVLLRRLNQLGWSTYEKGLPTDEGNRAIHEAWIAFKEQWNVEWPAGLHDMPI